MALGVLAKDMHFKRLVERLSYLEFDSHKQKKNGLKQLS